MDLPLVFSPAQDLAESNVYLYVYLRDKSYSFSGRWFCNENGINFLCGMRIGYIPIAFQNT